MRPGTQLLRSREVKLSVPQEVQFQNEIPGAKGQNHVKIKDAMHYTQDDEGVQFAAVVIEFIAANP